MDFPFPHNYTNESSENIGFPRGEGRGGRGVEIIQI